MPSWVKQSKQNSQWIILQALYDESLSWSELREKTHLSKDALSRHLSSMRQEGVLKESVSRSNKGARSMIKYSLKDSCRKKISKIIESLKNYSEIERKTHDYSRSSFWFWLHSEKDPKVLNSYIETISNAIAYVFLSELVREPSDRSSDEYVTSQAMSMLRRMIWGSEFVRELKLDQKREILEESKKKRLEDLLDEIKKMQSRERMAREVEQSQHNFTSTK